VKIAVLKYHIERREHESTLATILSIILAILAALLISALLIRMDGANVLDAYRSLFIGGFGSWRAIFETLNKATPLIFTGLATVVAFRAQIWNIGGEGQFLAGAMAAYLAITLFPKSPNSILIIVILVFALLAGGAIAGISSFIKNRFNVDVIVSTVMINYIIKFALSLMLYTSWRDSSTFYPQSPFIPENSYLPMLVEKYRFHAGFILAVLFAIITFLLVEKTPAGYELRALGFNPIAAKSRGINPKRTLMWILLVSGSLAALGGAVELIGLTHRLRLDISINYGFTGIIVAMLADLNPLGVLVTGILFGGLTNGSFAMQVKTGVPTSIAFAIQAIILLFVLTASILTRYTIRKVEDAH